MKGSGKIGAAILFVITRPLAALPLGFHRACGKFLGWVVGSVAGYRKHVVMINLARCFPDKKYDELKEISKRFYRHFGTVAAEAIWLGGCYSPNRIRKNNYAEITNPEILNKFIGEGKSVFMLSAHCGNWESIASFMSFNAKEKLKLNSNDFAAVYRRLSSPAWEIFMHKNRCRTIEDKKHFDGLVETSGIIRYILSHQDHTKLYFFHTDQYPYGAAKIPVRFMGQDTFTMTGGPALAHKLSLPVVYYSMKVKEDGNYAITITPIAEDGSKCEVADMMNSFYSLLEQDLAAQPWNYLWTHKRWK